MNIPDPRLQNYYFITLCFDPINEDQLTNMVDWVIFAKNTREAERKAKQTAKKIEDKKGWKFEKILSMFHKNYIRDTEKLMSVGRFTI